MPPEPQPQDGELPDGVLWDMDGTIVDTEPYWMAAEIALVAAYGGTWTVADGLTLVGQPLLTSAAMIIESSGIPLTPHQVVAHLVDEVVARVSTGAPWMPGTLDLLAELRTAGVPMALVTMSYALLADAVVAQLPSGTFEAVVTGDHVTNGKPHPEPYLTGAKHLGLEPEQCVAIEDSPTGLASAEAAGCRSLGVQTHVAIPPAPGRSRLRSLAGIRARHLAGIGTGVVLDEL